jgi:hypothetical protein
VEYRAVPEVTQAVRAPSPQPEVVVAPVIEPVLLPPIERRPVPQVARAVEPFEPVAQPEPQPTPQPTPEPSVSPPDPALVAELEAIGRSARALAAELARRRDLLAADLALAQGRLVTPPESSAYTLYSRVLAQDPGSDRASRGLQAIRQGLINQVLAQLAGGDLDAARMSLQAAERVGANPQLVTDLGGEVDYRQRLIDAQAGRFDTLYPMDHLVAISQEPPRVSRVPTSGPEVSVEVQFTVTVRGDVSDVAVLDDVSAPIAEAVRRAVSEWRFEPVRVDGRPIPVRSSVRFAFRS